MKKVVIILISGWRQSGKDTGEYFSSKYGFQFSIANTI
jgi:hypothetical protein